MIAARNISEQTYAHPLMVNQPTENHAPLRIPTINDLLRTGEFTADCVETDTTLTFSLPLFGFPQHHVEVSMGAGLLSVVMTFEVSGVDHLIRYVHDLPLPANVQEGRAWFKVKGDLLQVTMQKREQSILGRVAACFGMARM